MSTSAVKEALERVGAAISSDPAKARAKNAPATARLKQGLQCEVTGPHQERLSTDMPPAMGGAASGPNPGWLLRAALASCTATSIAMRAAKLGVALTDVEVSAESESDNRGMLGLAEGVSAGLGTVRMKVRIAGAGSPERLKEIVQWADEHSVVGCTIRQATGCSLEIEATGNAN